MTFVKIFLHLLFVIFVINASVLDSIKDKLNIRNIHLKREQSYGLCGTFLCDNRPIEMVKVQLFDKDRNSFNDLMNRQYSDKMGRYNFYGSEFEMGQITPLVVVEHQCKARGREIKRIECLLPRELITVGPYPNKFCNLGIVDLNNATSLKCQNFP
uniref:ZP domain-containing protein n=1 Tax=Parastrongyloides trichosuri TaxID=131310 RepID=A0A0N4ZIE0_PARTI